MFMGVASSATRVVADAHQCTFHMSTITTPIALASSFRTALCVIHSWRPTVLMDALRKVTLTSEMACMRVPSMSVRIME